MQMTPERPCTRLRAHQALVELNRAVPYALSAATKPPARLVDVTSAHPSLIPSVFMSRSRLQRGGARLYINPKRGSLKDRDPMHADATEASL